MKLAGLIVLYNPDKSIHINIEIYKRYFDFLILIDNSELGANIAPTLEEKKISYIRNSENLGIAKALNIGLGKAVREAFECVLILDQDSYLSQKTLTILLDSINSLRDENWGIISPYQKDSKYEVQNENDGIKEVLTTITSGSILNLEAYQKSGPFIDNLFIDYVDFEYCLRLRKNGYKIYQCNDAVLDHCLGNMETKHIFNKSFSVTHHSPVRYYYRTRNRLYVINKYKKDFPDFAKQDRKLLITDLLKIIFYEKNKLLKIKYIFKGFVDYKRNRFGRIN